MKNCKKCNQSFFDEVEECGCGSKKFNFTTPQDKKISKGKDPYGQENDNDEEFERQLAEQEQEELEQKQRILDMNKMRNSKPFNPKTSPNNPFTITTTTRTSSSFNPLTQLNQLAQPFTPRKMSARPISNLIKTNTMICECGHDIQYHNISGKICRVAKCDCTKDYNVIKFKRRNTG